MNSNRCSACKVMKCDCDPGCILAPHFPLTNLESFERLHRIFGVENVCKILVNLESPQRKIAIRALCYEAEARERDPIFGYVGMFDHYQHQLKILEEQINSAKNELVTIIGPDKVPQYSSHPMPYDFLTTNSSLQSYIEKMEGLNEVQKNELMQLPIADTPRILNERFRKKEDEKMCDGHGDADASTSIVSSMACESTSATHETLPSPQNQNQP